MGVAECAHLLVTLLGFLSIAIVRVTSDSMYQPAPAPARAPAAEQTFPYENNLNPVVAPSPATDNGTDWCKPFKPCNRTGRASAESSYGYGLAPVGGAISLRSSAYRYASIVPPAAVDWRQTLQPWPVRDQGQCGTSRSLLVELCLGVGF